MRRHVVRAFQHMGEIGHRRVIPWRHEAAEEGLKVNLNVRVGVFLHQQRARGMPHEQGQQAVALDPARHVPGELVQAGATGLDGECRLHGARIGGPEKIFKKSNKIFDGSAG